MSNAAVVTPALFRGGPLHRTPPHNRRSFVTLWPFRPCGNKFVWFVPPLPFRVLLFHMERAISAEKATLSGLVAVFACKTHPAWPTTGPFKHPGLGSEHVDPWREFRETRTRCRGTSREGWKNPVRVRAQMPMQRSNKWVDGLSVQHLPFLFANLFAWRGFYEARQPWRMSLNHGTSTQRPPLTDVYCMGP